MSSVAKAKNNIIWGTVVVCLLLLGLPEFAQAHAIVLSSTPKPGAVLRASDISVELQFNSRIDHAHSRLTLVEPDSRKIELVLLPEARPEVLQGHTVIDVPGSYRLRWQVLSIDGHITRGDINFTVKK